MSLKKLLNDGYLKKHKSSKKEIEDLLAIVERDFEDATLEGLSIDRAFATLYNAALNLARILIYKNGYRVSVSKAHHAITFEAAGYILGQGAKGLIDFFDSCRKKRNRVEYDFSGVASHSELKDIEEKVFEFKELIGI